MPFLLKQLSPGILLIAAKHIVTVTKVLEIGILTRSLSPSDALHQSSQHNGSQSVSSAWQQAVWTETSESGTLGDGTQQFLF